jgi:TBC1 domain family member 8/9
MVVLADEVLESFFESDFSASFRLDPLETSIPSPILPLPSSGLLGDIWSSIATDSNKKMFNMLSDEVGRAIGKHQVEIDFSHIFKPIFSKQAMLFLLF